MGDDLVPRVLITGFCAVPGPSRAGVQLRHVVRALSADHTVDLLVVRDGDQAYVERQGNVRVLRVPTHDSDLRVQIQAFQRALRRQLDGADYDVIHCRDGWSGKTVLDAREAFGYAVVFDVTRGPWVEPSVDPELAAEIDRDNDRCIAEADLVLVPTEPARRHAIARTRPDKVVVSPPGVDVDRFDWDDAPPAAGAVPEPRILYAGALEPGRGVRTVLRAMVDLVKVVPARLLLVGPIAPGFEEPLRAAVRDLRLDGVVTIEPPVDHDAMPRLIASATVCVVAAAPDLVPRATALYPTKLLEFMACRRAVVAPRRGTVAMLIDHGREGMLFQPTDPGDLTRKLLRLLQDADLRERMAQHGYERVRREFTASGARRAVRSGYQVLAERPQFRQRFLDSATGSGKAVAADLSASEPGVSDDDFEATVFESPPTGDDSSDSLSPLETALDALDADHRTGDNPVTEEREAAPEETSERAIAPPRPRNRLGLDSGAFTTLTAEQEPQVATDEWVVRPPTIPNAPRPREVGSSPSRPKGRAISDDDGTPVDVSVTISPLSPDGPPVFVAGEIDVPTPPPEINEDEGFTAASTLLGPRGGNGAGAGGPK
jgi:glycosyltransferase involved in cell wall biosynthesis